MLYRCVQKETIGFFPWWRDLNLFLWRILTGCRVNDSDCVFVYWAPLACLRGAGISWLLHCLVPSFRSFFQCCSGPRRLQAVLCSKSLVCHLNEAFGAKKTNMKIPQCAEHYLALDCGMFWEYVGSPFLDCYFFSCVFSNCYLLYCTHRAPGPLVEEKKKA